MTVRWFPHVTVACVIPRNDEFLMVEEIIGGKTVFNQPAGHLEEGESLQEAALRETREETAWQVCLESLIASYLWRMNAENSFLRFCFLARIEKQLPNKIDPAINATHWMSYDDIIENKDKLRSPLVLRSIEDYRAGMSQPLSTVHYIE